MTRLQLLRAQALLVDLLIEARRVRALGDAAAAGSLETDREQLVHAMTARTAPRSLREIVPDGVFDEWLELLLGHIEGPPAARR